MKLSFLSPFLHHKRITFLVLLGLVVGALALWRLLPASKEGMRLSTCMIDGEQAIYLFIDGKSMVMQRDSIHMQGTWMNRRWWLPSCLGRIETVAPHIHLFNDKPWPKNQTELRKLIQEEIDSLSSHYPAQVIEQKELAYYLRSHGVQDEGYGLIAKYADRQKASTDSMRQRLAFLKTAKARSKVALLCRRNFKAWWIDRFGKYQESECKPTLSFHPLMNRCIAIQTSDQLTPLGVAPVSRYPWIIMRHRKLFAVSLIRRGQTRSYEALIVAGHADKESHDIPELLAPQGAPVFTPRGCYAGSIDQNKIRR